MIKLYYDLMSPPSRALLTLLKAVKLPFEEKPVALRNREHLTEQFAKEVSQFRRVPVIHDGDFILTESSAILRYVRRKYPDLFTDYWYPADVKAQARVDEYMSWAHNGIRMVVGLAFFTKFRDPLLNGIPADPALVKQYDTNVQKTLNDFERLWTAGDYKFITGDKFTIADLFAACDLEQSRMTGIDPFEGRPQLAKWFDRTRSEMDPLFTEHHKFVYKFADMIKHLG